MNGLTGEGALDWAGSLFDVVIVNEASMATVPLRYAG